MTTTGERALHIHNITGRYSYQCGSRNDRLKFSTITSAFDLTTPSAPPATVRSTWLHRHSVETRPTPPFTPKALRISAQGCRLLAATLGKLALIPFTLKAFHSLERT